MVPRDIWVRTENRQRFVGKAHELLRRRLPCASAFWAWTRGAPRLNISSQIFWLPSELNAGRSFRDQRARHTAGAQNVFGLAAGVISSLNLGVWSEPQKKTSRLCRGGFAFGKMAGKAAVGGDFPLQRARGCLDRAQRPPVRPRLVVGADPAALRPAVSDPEAAGFSEPACSPPDQDRSSAAAARRIQPAWFAELGQSSSSPKSRYFQRRTSPATGFLCQVTKSVGFS